MRVQLLNQTLLDLGFYDDGPYEVADQKQLNAELIPVPSHSYLGRICPPCSLLPCAQRRESEGQWWGTSRLRLLANMAAKTTAASNSSSCQNASNGSFPVDYFRMSLSVSDSRRALNLECYSASDKLNVFPCESEKLSMMPAFAKVWPFSLSLSNHRKSFPKVNAKLSQQQRRRPHFNVLPSS